MLDQINGLHHVTSISSDARGTDQFFANVLGLRRVKKTVNFDHPEVYHLYYGDEVGTPGSVMTYFPFQGSPRGKKGTGEVSETAFSVPEGSLDFWRDRLSAANVADIAQVQRFGDQRLTFSNDDGESFALVEVANDHRSPWTGNGVSADQAIRGFHSATMRLGDDGGTSDLLRFMGYRILDSEQAFTRFQVGEGDAAVILDVEDLGASHSSEQGAGSVHHIAFSVDDREAQLEVRKALGDQGFAVTPVIDRDYFWAIYFRAPGGVLFEVATNEPGFDRDESVDELGKALKLPTQHQHLRSFLEQHLQPID